MNQNMSQLKFKKITQRERGWRGITDAFALHLADLSLIDMTLISELGASLNNPQKQTKKQKTSKQKQKHNYSGSSIFINTVKRISVGTLYL